MSAYFTFSRLSNAGRSQLSATVETRSTFVRKLSPLPLNNRPRRILNDDTPAERFARLLITHT